MEHHGLCFSFFCLPTLKTFSILRFSMSVYRSYIDNFCSIVVVCGIFPFRNFDCRNCAELPPIPAIGRNATNSFAQSASMPQSFAVSISRVLCSFVPHFACPSGAPCAFRIFATFTVTISAISVSLNILCLSTESWLISLRKFH